MAVEILLRNEVEREIEANSTTEFSDCVIFSNAIQNEGTPKEKL
jgi:hypothetical protein